MVREADAGPPATGTIAVGAAGAGTGGDAGVRLVRAAEQLFAERGLAGVSLREITALAGVGNASAIQYHFGDRSGLIRAVIARHHPTVEARRHALLDQYEADGNGDLRTLTGALVRPLAAELDDIDGGEGYLQVMADLATAPRPVLSSASIEDPDDSTYRWRALVAPRLSPEALRLHRRFTAVQFTLTELARRSRDTRARELATLDHQLFVSHLVDLVTAVLGAPVSEETRRRAGRRGRRAPD